jgi:hypothetical protein
LHGELIDHHLDWLCPAGQELPGVQCGGRFLGECALLDEDNIDATLQSSFGGTEA